MSDEILLGNQIPYPAEEEMICAALVRELGRTKSWISHVDTANALLNIRLHAKSMRDEQNHLMGGSMGDQSNQDAQPQPDQTGFYCEGVLKYGKEILFPEQPPKVYST